MTKGRGRATLPDVLSDFGTAAGTPRVRLRSDGGPIELKLEHLLPSGSVYDRIAAPLLAEALGAGESGPFLVAGCGSACLSFAAAARRARAPVELVLPESTLSEHRRLLAQHRAKVHPSPGSSLVAASELAAELAGRGLGRLLYAPTRPELGARAVWARTLGRELLDELAPDAPVDGPAAGPSAGPVVFLPSGLGDLAEALAPHWPTWRVSSAGGCLQDGAFDAGEHACEASLSDEEAHRSRVRLAGEEGLLLGYATAAAVEAARRAVATGAVSAALVVALDAGDRYFSYDRRFSAGP